MRKGFIFALIIGFSAFFCPAPKAKALDPVTMALLAPVAIKVAEKATPYVISGLANGARGMVVIGKDMLDFFRLPLGLLQSTLGAPLGFFSSGVKNIAMGGVAPFKMALHTLMLPLYFFGAAGP